MERKNHSGIPVRQKYLKIIFVILLLFFIFPANLSAEENFCANIPPGRYPLMYPDQATMARWVNSYRMAPIPVSSSSRIITRGSVNLLSHLQYSPAERDQGNCGNCWAWAGTGCMEIALSVNSGIKDRLSVQYINSCETQVIGKSRCNGGWLYDVAHYYSSTKKAVPWSNTNASYQDGDGTYDISCSLISTTPNYPITSINEATISTQGVSQVQAIANIKNALNQGQAIWFAFFLPTGTAWNDFFNFWDYQGESVVYNIDKFSGNYQNGGGHAVLCVGYNDTDPNNSYWVMVNSWGTAGGRRPNGIFRVNINMNYSLINSPYSSFYWQVLNVQYSQQTPVAPVLNSLQVTDRTSGSTSITDETTVNVALTADGNPQQMILSENSSFSGAAWQTYLNSTSFVLSSGAGAKTVYVKLKNSVGESNIKSAAITLASPAALPVISAFSLAAKDSGSVTVTADRSVNYSISAENSPVQMMISEDSRFRSVRWQSFASGGTFVVSSKVGKKTVYLKLKNSTGQSQVVQSSITYNPAINAPVVSFFDVYDRTSASNWYTNERKINFICTSSKTPTHFQISESSKFTKANWQRFQSPGTFDVSKKEGLKYIYIRLKNSYGTSQAVSSWIYYYTWYTDWPTASALTVSGGSGSPGITGSRQVTLNFQIPDVREVQVSENPELSGAAWQRCFNSAGLCLSPGDGEKTVYARVKNSRSETSKTLTARIILDTAAPEIRLHEPGIRDNSLSGTISDASPLDQKTLAIIIDGQPVTDGLAAGASFDSYDSAQNSFSYRPKSVLSPGRHQIKITVKDLAGNEGVAVIDDLRVAGEFKIENILNCPNPFSSATDFTYLLTRDAEVSVKIYTTRGELLKTLTVPAGTDGGRAGFNKISWSGNDENGKLLANGLYLYLVTARDSEGNKVGGRGKAGIVR